MSLPFDPALLDARTTGLAVLLAWGLYLFVTGQPLGRPKPDLAERLDRLDVEHRLRLEGGRRARKQLFRYRWLEGMLRPIVEDVGGGLRGLFDRFGLGDGDALERKLSVVRPGVGPREFWGEKALTGIALAVLFPVMNAVGVKPLGSWPLWVSLAAFAVGFILPDLQLNARLKRRRTDMVMELPAVIDMLTITASAGLGIEQALDVVARESQGLVADEFVRVHREMVLGQRTFNEALEAMADRSLMPELQAFVSQLRSAHEQGLPLTDALSAQAESVRERKRVRIIEQGGKAQVRMVLPVALFILPVFFAIMLWPAVVETLNFGG